MSEISVTSSPRSDKQDIGAICDALEILAEKLDGSDAKNLLAAVDELLRAERIWSDLEDLAGELAEIQKLHKLDVASRPDVVGMVDLAGSILALDAICRFLRLRAPYDTLNLLLNGLRDLAEGGSPAAMFLPLERPKGRRPDVPTVMAAKGILAGVMHRQQATGLSREAAARWIVEHTSPTLAARISGKPLTPRMVEEWLDRFGGDHAEWNLGRKTYVIWSQGEALTVEKFRSITEQIAREFPGKEPR
jgi:hypothetical protein